MKKLTIGVVFLLFTLISCDQDNELKEEQMKFLNAEEYFEILSEESLRIQSYLEDQQISLDNYEKYGLKKQEISTQLQPLLESSYSYLKGVGLSDEEISQSIGINDLNLIIVGIGTLVHDNSPEGKNISSYRSRELNCLIEALGLNAFDMLREGFKTGAKLAAKTMLKSVAKRLLGPIGVAITVAEFAWCMSR